MATTDKDYVYRVSYTLDNLYNEADFATREIANLLVEMASNGGATNVKLKKVQL